MIVDLNAVKEIAKKYHAGDVDKANVDYFEGHLTTVASLVDSDIEKAVAYLHDTIEDTEADADSLLVDLLDGGINPADAFIIVDAVVAVTKKDGEDYNDYLIRVGNNPLAVSVKLADLSHNMDTSRLPVVDDEAIKRLKKYEIAKEFLMNI